MALAISCLCTTRIIVHHCIIYHLYHDLIFKNIQFSALHATPSFILSSSTCSMQEIYVLTANYQPYVTKCRKLQANNYHYIASYHYSRYSVISYTTSMTSDD